MPERRGPEMDSFQRTAAGQKEARAKQREELLKEAAANADGEQGMVDPKAAETAAATLAEQPPEQQKQEKNKDEEQPDYGEVEVVAAEQVKSDQGQYSGGGGETFDMSGIDLGAPEEPQVVEQSKLGSGGEHTGVAGERVEMPDLGEDLAMEDLAMPEATEEDAQDAEQVAAMGFGPDGMPEGAVLEPIGGIEALQADVKRQAAEAEQKRAAEEAAETATTETTEVTPEAPRFEMSAEEQAEVQEAVAKLEQEVADQKLKWNAEVQAVSEQLNQEQGQGSVEIVAVDPRDEFLDILDGAKTDKERELFGQLADSPVRQELANRLDDLEMLQEQLDGAVISEEQAAAK